MRAPPRPTAPHSGGWSGCPTSAVTKRDRARATSARTREGEIAEIQEAISGLLERAPQ
jgi:hypothetical protein